MLKAQNGEEKKLNHLTYRIRVKVLNQSPLGRKKAAAVGGAALATVEAHTRTVRDHLDCELTKGLKLS